VDTREARGQVDHCPDGWSSHSFEMDFVVPDDITCRVEITFCFKCGDSYFNPDSITLTGLYSKTPDPACTIYNILANSDFFPAALEGIQNRGRALCGIEPCGASFIQEEYIMIPTCGKIVQFLENGVPYTKMEACGDNYCVFYEKFCYDYNNQQQDPVRVTIETNVYSTGIDLFCLPMLNGYPPFGADPMGEWETHCFQYINCPVIIIPV